MLSLPVYLDNNATTRCDPQVVEAMLPYFTEQFGNAASRSHLFGWVAAEAVELAREQVAELVGAEPGEILFTSGATEANNLALKGVFENYATKGNHIITVATEHKAVLDTCTYLQKLGAEVTVLPVNAQGLVDIDQLEAAITPQTILIAVMYANNETGVLQAVESIGAVAEKHGVLFFSDGVQAVGKIPVNVQQAGIHLLSMSAHKMYGPKGVGALYVRRRSPRVKPAAQIHGGGHERGMRSGTMNVPGIVGFGKAADIAMHGMAGETHRIKALRDLLEAELLKLDGVRVNGSRQHRLHHVTNLAFHHVEGEGLMMHFNKNVAVSSGSACTSATLHPSHVLKAMGLTDDQAFSSLRFSIGRFNTPEEIDFVIGQVQQSVQKMREMRNTVG